jgi:chaperonin GroES
LKSTINYEPRGDRVVVRRLERPAPKPGEVIVPGSMQKQLDEGIVVAVGPGLRNRLTWQIDPVDLEPGDHVCFGDFAGSEIEVDGEKFLSMRDEEIHGRRPVGAAKDPLPMAYS